LKRVETEERVFAEFAMRQGAQRNATCCGPCKVEERELDGLVRNFNVGGG